MTTKILTTSLSISPKLSFLKSVISSKLSLVLKFSSQSGKVASILPRRWLMYIKNVLSASSTSDDTFHRINYITITIFKTPQVIAKSIPTSATVYTVKITHPQSTTMVEPVSIATASFAAVNAGRIVVRDLLDIMKRRHQRDLNQVEWKQVENSCKTMKDLLRAMTTEPDRITQETDQALFTFEMSSAKFQFEHARFHLTKLRGIEITDIHHVQNVSIPSEIRDSMDQMDHTNKSGESAQNIGSNKTEYKDEASPTITSPNQRKQAPNISSEQVKLDDPNEPDKLAPNNTISDQ